MIENKPLYKTPVNPDTGTVRIALSFVIILVPVLFFLSCTSLTESKTPETAPDQLSDRVFDIRFDDGIPITVRLDQTGLPDANKEYRIRIEYVERSNTSAVSYTHLRAHET